MDPWKMYFLLKMVIFHCHVSLPEGIFTMMMFGLLRWQMLGRMFRWYPWGFVTSTRHGLIIPLESKAEARCVTLERLFLRGSRFFLWVDEKSTPPKFNSSPLKNDVKGRRGPASFWGWVGLFFDGQTVNFSGFKQFIDVLIYGGRCWSRLVGFVNLSLIGF